MAAGPAQLAANRGLTMPEIGQSMPTERISLSQRASMVDLTAMNSFRKSPIKVAESEAPIVEAPAGERVQYSRDAFGFYVYWFWILFGEQDSQATSVVYGDDGYAYIYNPFSGWTTNTYLKCEVKDNKLVAELPQLIYQETYDEETTSYYADILHKVVEVTDEGESISYVPSDTDEIRTVSWTIDGDNLTLDMEYDTTPDEDGNLAYPEVMFGMVDPEGVWTIAGDCVQNCKRVDYKTLDIPTNLEYKDWVFVLDGVGQHIPVAFDGNDVYIADMTGYFPNGAIKGTIDGDKVIFESKQYMGEAAGYYIHFMGATYDESNYYLADNITLSYDAEKQIMKADEGTAMIYNGSLDRIYYLAIYDAPEFRVYNPNPNPVPGNPIPTGYSNYLQSYGYNYFQFDLPNLNVDNDLLDTDNMYYQVLFDDEVWVFEPGDYEIEEDMEDIPYSFSEGGFYASGVSHTLYIYFEGYDTIGLKLFNVVDGETYASNKVTLDINTMTYTIDDSGSSEVESVTANSVATSVEFFNLNGVKVANPSNGIFVCKKTFEDGSSKVSKVIVK